MSNEKLKQEEQKSLVPEMEELQIKYNNAVELVDNIVLKNYLSNLSDFEVKELSEEIKKEGAFDNIRLFKIDKIVYEKDEPSLYKLTSVLNSVSCRNCSVFVLMKSDGKKTEFYIGVRENDPDKSVHNLEASLKASICGQFPGTVITKVEDEETVDCLRKENKVVSSVSCVANQKDKELKDNKSFIQGLEKLALSLQGSKYTAVIIADSQNQEDINSLRKTFETVYTSLSPFANNQLNYGVNQSYSYAFGTNETHTEGTSFTKTESNSETLSQDDEETQRRRREAENQYSVPEKYMPWDAKLIRKVPLFRTLDKAVKGFLVNLEEPINSLNKKTVTTSKSTSEAYGENEQDSVGTNETETDQTGSSQGSTVTVQNKTVLNLLDRLDKQMKRLDEFESLGMWSCAAYFVADDVVTAENAANTYRAIMRGENTGLEASAVNTWCSQFETKKQAAQITEYLSKFINPVFLCYLNDTDFEVTATNFVSGNELAVHMGFPRHSVCGLPVVEHAEFAKEVYRYERNTESKSIDLGKIFDMGKKTNTDVSLDVKSLAMHTFVTGSTGSGKSNTIYNLLDNLGNNGVNFMVIEPAKGEYKDVFGNRNDVTVFGTNKKVFANLLKINPFVFPKESCHVYEHIDRIVEIFNVCWPMYAAMPAVLKEAVINSYKKCGWDLEESTNDYNLYPTFTDLLSEITSVIENSAYSAEVKGNYIGSLVTRVKSLTNGINGQIFSSNEVDNELLFDSNVIVDISRIGSAETKALIMGVLVMRLNEYRVDNASEANTGLKHITVLEEAHNILRRTSTEQNPDAPSVAGKSVEMISNAIAEMRTYGEGFIIADQSPTSVDISAIKNTNTKIIMRLPERDDRDLSGKSAALKDEQLDEIAKLPIGKAVVYQNNWVEPVLCAIDEFKPLNEDGESNIPIVPAVTVDNKAFKTEIIKLALSYKNAEKFKFDFEFIKSNVDSAELSSEAKLIVHKLIEEETNRPEKKYKEVCDMVNAFVSNGESFETMISSSTERKFNAELCSIVSPQINDDELLVDINQCILYKYAFENPDGKKKYDNWRELVVKGVI